MTLTKVKLGDYISLRENKNTELLFGPQDVRGVNNLKKLMPTKADISGRDLTKFQIVHPGEFVFNHRTSRNGSKFSIAYNDGDKPVICTEDYVVFGIREEIGQTFLAEWLYMFFNRPEFDRYVITNSWGSSTEFYNWEDLCDIELPLPPVEIQQKYVAIYQAMLANQQSYEKGLDDLRLTSEACIEKCKYNAPTKYLFELVEECDNRNVNNSFSKVCGVNKEKQFMPTVARGENLSRYKIVYLKQFACNFMHVGRDVAVPVALNLTGKTFLVSPAYFVFKVDSKVILPEFLLMWLSRKETDRHAWFMSDSSVRSGMEKNRFLEMSIPIPPLDKQRYLIEIYNSLLMREIVNEKLKEQIKKICPILIKGSLDEAGL